MKTETKIIIKKVLFTVLLIFSFYLVLLLLQIFGEPVADAGIKQSAAVVIKEWNTKAPQIGERLPAGKNGWDYTLMYRAKQGNKNAGIYILVRVTGYTGPYTGVFYTAPGKGTVFCGLAGLGDKKKPAMHYGITDRIIANRIKKIDELNRNTGVLE